MNSRTALALAGFLATPVVPAQTCNAYIRPSAPDARYVVDSVKGTVLDRKTGLTWKRCVEGRSGTLCGLGNEAYLTWRGAFNRAAASDFAGHKDWRLPNRKELESLVEVACHNPAINSNVFPNEPSAYMWASSPYASFAYNAWYVGFDYGYSFNYNRNYVSAVRLVRGGQ